MTLCRWVEWAEKFTIRAHGAFRSRGSAARTQRTIPITPSSTAWRHCVVGEVFEAAHRAGSDGVDEHIEFAVPPLPHLDEQRLDALGVGDIRDQSHGIGAAQTRQFRSGFVKDGLCAADNGDACAVLGEASRRGQTHPATAADHHRSRVLKSEIHCVTTTLASTAVEPLLAPG